MTAHGIEALAFDIFGTVVDWRSGVARDARAALATIGRDDVDPFAFAHAWRDAFQPLMGECRSGRRPYVQLDDLIREALDDTLAAHGIDRADPALRADWLGGAWRRLDPWPDVLPGFALLQPRFPLVALSNGNFALTVELARYGGYRWDAVLGAEFAQTYKPLPEAYDAAIRALRIEPHQLCLVAAHEDDLAAAQGRGVTTAYVARPKEFGDIAPKPQAQPWPFEAPDLPRLALMLRATG